jgi:hypothetical protein
MPKGSSLRRFRRPESRSASARKRATLASKSRPVQKIGIRAGSGATSRCFGRSSGIGLATAKRFVNEGAFVFLTERRQSELDAAVNQIGCNVTCV